MGILFWYDCGRLSNLMICFLLCHKYKQMSVCSGNFVSYYWCTLTQEEDFKCVFIYSDDYFYLYWSNSVHLLKYSFWLVYPPLSITLQEQPPDLKEGVSCGWEKERKRDRNSRTQVLLRKLWQCTSWGGCEQFELLYVATLVFDCIFR